MWFELSSVWTVQKGIYVTIRKSECIYEAQARSNSTPERGCFHQISASYTPDTARGCCHVGIITVFPQPNLRSRDPAILEVSVHSLPPGNGSRRPSNPSCMLSFVTNWMNSLQLDVQPHFAGPHYRYTSWLAHVTVTPPPQIILLNCTRENHSPHCGFVHL